MAIDILAINRIIKDEIKERYAGYDIQFYASGFGCGIRDAHYDIFLKDGSRFVAVAEYDTATNRLTVKERDYIAY